MYTEYIIYIYIFFFISVDEWQKKRLNKFTYTIHIESYECIDMSTPKTSFFVQL